LPLCSKGTLLSGVRASESKTERTRERESEDAKERAREKAKEGERQRELAPCRVGLPHVGAVTGTRATQLQGYFAHKKQPPPLGPI